MTVVLQQDRPINKIAKVGPVLILTVGYESIPHLVVAFILQEFGAIEPMLNVIALYDNNSRIKLVFVKSLIFRHRDKIIKSTEFAVAFDS